MFVKVLSGNEAITSEIVASAHIENYAMKLFEWWVKFEICSRAILDFGVWKTPLHLSSTFNIKLLQLCICTSY